MKPVILAVVALLGCGSSFLQAQLPATLPGPGLGSEVKPTLEQRLLEMTKQLNALTKGSGSLSKTT